MATITNFTATLAYYDGSAWTSGAAAQGRYGSNLRVGVIYCPDMNLKGKTINSVRFRVTSTAAGNPATDTKIAYFYRSAYQKINTGVSGIAHKTGSSIGSASGNFYNNTLHFNADFLKSYIANGENTFCIYISESNQSGVNWSKNYLKWSSVMMTVDWDTPEVSVPGSATPAHGTLSYYYNNPISISWKPGKNAESYIVERAVSDDVHVDLFNLIASGVTEESFTDDSDYIIGVQNAMPLGGYCRYRIKSVGADGTMSSGGCLTGSFRRMLPQVAPADVVATVTDTYVQLKWNAETADFATFRIECSINGGAFECIGNPSGTSYIHGTGTLPAGSKLIYRIRCEQKSPEGIVILSDYSANVSVQISGGAYIKTESGWRKGIAWIHSGIKGYIAASKIKAKFNKWRDSK